MGFCCCSLPKTHRADTHHSTLAAVAEPSEGRGELHRVEQGEELRGRVRDGEKGEDLHSLLSQHELGVVAVRDGDLC